jgi:peptide/nickel transport system substrate-binding protein
VVIPDPETRAAQLMTGAIDWIWRVPPDQADSLKTNPKLAVQRRDHAVGFITLDTTGTSAPNSPFKDVRVRQAVNHAINRKGYAENLMRGGSQPVYTACFRTQFGCDSNAAIKFDYNPAKAKELLAAAGYRTVSIPTSMLTANVKSPKPSSATCARSASAHGCIT